MECVNALHAQAKKYDRAIAILARHGWWDKLIGVVRLLEKGDSRNLSACAAHFRKVGLS
jgi:intraflagellar transport protein 122